MYEYAYLGGDVVHLRGFASHGLDTIQREYLAGFLAGCVEVAECAGDTNGDFQRNVDDLLNLLSQWGTDDSACDLDGSGEVEVNDLLFLLSVFGQAC